MPAFILLILLSFQALMPAMAYGEDKEKFIVYYSDKEHPGNFKDYQVLVLDAKYHPPLQRLAEDGKTLLGYISLGEVTNHSLYYPKLKEQGLLFAENPNWKGSYGVDIRNPAWQKIVIESLIPALLRDGFNGVFFDTLDSPIELERVDPKKYKGMKEASINLIKAVRTNFPQVKIMVNRGYTILPQLAPYVDIVLGESVRNTYDFNKKVYHKVDESLYLTQVKWLKEAKQRNPKLKIYTLDYADPKDPIKITDIYSVQRANGFVPYVATIGLNEIVNETNVTTGSN